MGVEGDRRKDCIGRPVIKHSSVPYLSKRISFFRFFFPVQYGMFLYGYLMEWRKNPHWSLSCCLALLLPLNDLQGEISGLVGSGANVLDNQLEGGQTEDTTIFAAVKDSGAIDVSLEEGQQDNDSKMKCQNEKCPEAACGKTTCHKGSQTDLFVLRKTQNLERVHDPMHKKQEQSL